MLDALKLELQIVVNRLVDMGMGNGTQVPEGCVSFSNLATLREGECSQ